ncbi:MAG: transcriptional regulator [Bacteroidia bacterium]|nr:transcriptional regulator [Bacteroidia bacterium]
MNVNDLNKAFESRVRLGIMSALVVNERMDFNSLKELLGITDGNLASHIAALEKEEYLLVEKKFIGKKTNTTYQITKKGNKAFKEHIQQLEKLLKKLK